MKPLILLAAVAASTLFASENIAPNGIALPEGFQSWRLISSSHRTDNKTLRVILGNDTAIKAARAGKIHPWPEGTILAKLVWRDGTHAQWEAATIPEAFVHAEFMIKASKKYAATGGWGYARWLGTKLVPYGKDATFAQECIACHMPVQKDDYVYTRPSILP